MLRHRNQLKIMGLAIAAVVFVAFIALPVMADKNATPLSPQPILPLLDNQVFVGKLTLKTSTPTQISAGVESKTALKETITFKDGMLFSESFTARGYEACPYTAKMERKAVSFTAKCTNPTNLKASLAWTGKVVTATATKEKTLTGTVKLIEGKKVIEEYAINAVYGVATDIPISNPIVLEGTFGQTEDGCYFVATPKENIALEFPVSPLPENFGRPVIVRGAWSMTTVMHCGMSKQLIVETFEFSGQPQYPTPR